MEPLQILRSGEDANLTIKIGEREFKLHSFVLKAGSKYFRSSSSFTAVANGEGSTVHLPAEEIDPRVFEALLTFIYAKVFEVPDKYSVEDWRKTFVLADYLQVQGFQEYMSSGEPFDKMKTSIEVEASENQSNSPCLWLVEQLQITASLAPCSALQRALLAVLQPTLQDRPACAFFLRAFFHKKIDSGGVEERWSGRHVVHDDMAYVAAVCERLLAASLGGADEAPLEKQACKRRIHQLEGENARLREELPKVRKLEEENARLKEHILKAREALKGLSDALPQE